MTGVLAWVTLAVWAAAVPVGRRIRRHLLETRAMRSSLAAHHAATEGAYRAEVAAARAAAQATAAARAARSAVKAAEGRDLRPWAVQVGDRP